MVRHEWDALPTSVREAVTDRCGAEVVKVEPSDAGINSEFAGTLHLASGERMFCKGIVVDGPTSWMHRTEAQVNPHIPASVAPRLIGHALGGGWLLLLFEFVEGQHANLAPGSSDLPLIAKALSTASESLTPCPVGLRTLSSKVAWLSASERLGADAPAGMDPWARDNLHRIAAYERSAIELIDGDTLLHTDLHSLNILVSGSAKFVDWAWARRGAAWTDPAFLVIRMMEAGHTPESAEAWAATMPSWGEADPDAVTAFSVAVFGMWEYLRLTRPSRARKSATAAARRWVEHRLDNYVRPAPT